MAAPTTTIDKVRRRLVDLSTTNPLADDFTVIDEAISSAVTRYSQDRPREVVVDVTGAGTNYYALTGGGSVAASWVDGSSRVVSIDYPASTVANDYTPTWLDPDTDWTTYKSASITYLRLRNHAPTVSETVRLTYTAPHTHTTATDTVPTQELDALCDLAAYYACLALATKASANQDSIIAADSTNYRDSQLRFKQQAEAWLKSYEDRLGISNGTAGASATADWNRSNTVGQPFLTHNRRWR
jgi:microcompartment protein CcmK/EutM